MHAPLTCLSTSRLVSKQPPPFHAPLVIPQSQALALARYTMSAWRIGEARGWRNLGEEVAAPPPPGSRDMRLP
eukprot:753080-Hanusia_phi.AAC.1